MLMMKAKVYRAMGEKEHAIDALEQLSATVGINAQQKKECGEMLEELSGKPGE